MKIASLAALVGCFVCLLASVSHAQSLKVQLPNSENGSFLLDYGKIEEGTEENSLVTKSFDVANNGSDPISILSMNSDCACLSAEASQPSIEPGSTVTITFSYNSRRLGPFIQSLTLTTDASGQEEITIMAKGQVNMRPE